MATQSLWFLNDQQIVEQSTQLAKLVMKNDDQNEQLRDLFERLFAVGPTEDEIRECVTFLNTQAEEFREASKSESQAAQRAIASLCQALLASNRFLYVD